YRPFPNLRADCLRHSFLRTALHVREPHGARHGPAAGHARDGDGGPWHAGSDICHADAVLARADGGVDAVRHGTRSCLLRQRLYRPSRLLAPRPYLWSHFSCSPFTDWRTDATSLNSLVRPFPFSRVSFPFQEVDPDPAAQASNRTACLCLYPFPPISCW